MKPLFSSKFQLVLTLRITLNFIVQNLKNEEIGKKNHITPAYFNILFLQTAYENSSLQLHSTFSVVGNFDQEYMSVSFHSSLDQSIMEDGNSTMTGY